MTDQQSRAQAFHALHVPGDPLVLFNIWDAGSAKAVAEAGAKALATGSASVAAAQGYEDAEAFPLDYVLTNALRIVECTDLPVTLDFEGGYATEPDALVDNIRRVIKTGVVGINFEDQVIGDTGLHPVELQAERISAIRAAADEAEVDFFINARTDVWLGPGLATIKEEARLNTAIARGQAFAEAGASGFFIPGLADEDTIGRICDEISLPLNAMWFDAMPSHARLGELGVARISHGPHPYSEAMAGLTEKARAIYVS